MDCPHCGERAKDSMSATCEHCERKLTDTNEEFILKLSKWLDECVAAGEISRFKAKFLVHLATKPLRSVIIMDGWPKAPQNTEGRFDEGHYDISAGEVVKVYDTDLHVSLLDYGEITTLFPWREYMDDPYVRILVRADVPIVDTDAVMKILIDMLENRIDKSKSNDTDKRGHSETRSHETKKRSDETAGPIPERDGIKPYTGRRDR